MGSDESVLENVPFVSEAMLFGMRSGGAWFTSIQSPGRPPERERP
jgi:hypothetical protein